MEKCRFIKAVLASLPMVASYAMLLFSSVLPNKVTGQETLTLKQAVAIAADSSVQALNARYSYLQSQLEYHTFRIFHLPTVSLQTNPVAYNRVFVRRYDSESNIDIYRQQQSLYSSANLSVKQNLGLTGGQFYVDTEFGYLRNYGQGNSYTQLTTVPFRIGYSQNILDYNGYKWDRRIAPLRFERAHRQLLYEIASIAETSAGYFFNLASAQVAYRVAQQNLYNVDTLYRIGEERFRLGSLSKGDLLALKLQVINARTGLEQAELILKRSNAELCTYLKMEERGTATEVILPEDVVLNTVSADAAIAAAEKNNPTILELDEKQLVAERDLEQVIRKNRFTASVSASLGFNQVANTFSDAYTRPLQQNMVTVSVTVPLLDWGTAKGKKVVAGENLRLVKSANATAGKTVTDEVRNSVNELNTYCRQVFSAKEAREIADEAYNTTKELFIIGKSDVSSVNLAITAQMVAQNGYVQALKSYWSSYYKVKRLTLWDFDASQ